MACELLPVAANITVHQTGGNDPYLWRAPGLRLDDEDQTAHFRVETRQGEYHGN
jgi:hypothetical protein